MKKRLTILAVLAGFSASVLGQGQVALANDANSLIRIGDPVNGTPIPVSSIFFQLYVGTVGAPEGSLTSLLPIAPTRASAEGRIANTLIDVSSQFNVPPGAPATFQIWAWSNSFATYQEAANGGGLVGKSILFVAYTSPNLGGAPALPTSLAGLYPGFAVNSIPEPSTCGLLALGGTAVWWAARRQRRRL